MNEVKYLWTMHVTRRFRLSVTFGHFWKWKLGHGHHCPWCWLCVHFPALKWVIPYSEDALDEEA